MHERRHSQSLGGWPRSTAHEQGCGRGRGARRGHPRLPARPGKPSQTPMSSPVVGRLSQDAASSEGRCVGQCSRHLPLGPHGRRFRGPRSHPGCTASPVSLICKTRIIRQPAPSVGVRLMWVRHAHVQPMLAFPIAIRSPKGTLRISLASRNQIKVEETERKRVEGGEGRRPRGRKKLV